MGFGWREFRFSYVDTDGETRYTHARNEWLAAKQVGRPCTRAPLPKTMPARTGHCQICAREIGATKGTIAHHGYTRPGSGWQTASCFGAKYRPYEVATDALPKAIEGLTRWIVAQKKHAAEMMNTPPATMSYETSTGYGYNKKTEKHEVPKPEGFSAEETVKVQAERKYGIGFTYRSYESLWVAKLAGIKSDIRASIEYRTFLEKRLAEWPGVKPLFEYGGKK